MLHPRPGISFDALLCTRVAIVNNHPIYISNELYTEESKVNLCCIKRHIIKVACGSINVYEYIHFLKLQNNKIKGAVRMALKGLGMKGHACGCVGLGGKIAMEWECSRPYGRQGCVWGCCLEQNEYREHLCKVCRSQ